MAMRFRDLIADTVTSIVDRLRPEPQYGSVLSVAKGGAEFRIGSSDAPEGPAPESPSNPRQVYYATVRLDTGEIVTARVHESIPVFREASFYDPTSGEGSDNSYLILSDTYRRKIVVPRTDPSGQIYDSVEPDTSAHMAYEPTVPPRVMIEGHAGRYVLTRIVRGLSRLENVVLDKPIIVNEGRYYAHIVDPLNTSDTELRPISTEFATQYQGFIGDCGWSGAGSYEIEIRNGGRNSRYRISTDGLKVDDWGKWFIAVPVEDGLLTKDPGASAESSLQVPLVYYDTTGFIYFYIATRNLTEFYVSDERYLGGSATLRAIGGKLVPNIGGVLPAAPGVTETYQAWGLSTTGPLIRTAFLDYAPRGSLSSFASNLHHLQHSMTGGGIKRVNWNSTTGEIFLTWSKRFLVMTAVNQYQRDGYFSIVMPPVGTEIPYVGGFATDGGPRAARTVTSSGVDMSGWCGLYYALPFGAADSIPGNFVIVNYNGWFDIPDHWILVARRNAGGATDDNNAVITLGNGQQLDYWRTLTIPNWSGAIANASQPPACTKINEMVYLSGVITCNSAIADGVFSTNAPLPVGFRPWRTWMQPTLYSPGDEYAGRLDITSAGNIGVRTAVAASGQVWLDGISYPAQN